MTSVPRVSVACLVLALAGCAPSAAPRAADGTGAHEVRPAAPQRIVAAIQGDPHTLYQKMNPSSRIPGIENLELLVNAGLARGDDLETLRPQLAEGVPSLSNGLWKVFPDGRMETTWKIRAGAEWHDGAPFTADDLLFTASVVQDRELEVLVDRAYQAIDRVEAADSRTVTVKWKRPYIQADEMFTPNRAMPIPKHILARSYTEEKERFLEQPFWTEEFIGTGPFKLRQFIRGSHLVVEANDRYVLGRPKIDEIVVKFIPDQNTLIANVLAGAVDLTMSRGLSLEQANQVREQWKNGAIAVKMVNWLWIYPQFVNPNPVIVTDARFRRALLHATDRQEMADVIQQGVTPVAHSIINPQDPVYRDVEASIVRYEYDPRRAAQIIESLGYVRGTDGFRDSANQKLSVELRTSTTRDVSGKAVNAVADYWQRAGVGVDISITPAQLARDVEYRETFPAFELAQNPNAVSALASFGPDPAGRLIRGRYSYRNPELDALIERLFVTVDPRERLPILRGIIHHITDQVRGLGLFYGADPFLISNRLRNIGPGNQEADMAWNAHEWEVTEGGTESR